MKNEIKTQLEEVVNNQTEGVLLILDLREDKDSSFSQQLLREGWNYQIIAMDLDCVEYYLETGDLDGESYGEEQSLIQAEKTAKEYLSEFNGYVIVK